MFDVEKASTGARFALLEGRLLANELDPGAFVSAAEGLGVSRSFAEEAKDKYLAISQNQQDRRSRLRAAYDFIVVGSGAAGAVVARRLAERTGAHILLLEAGASDLAPGILIPETWFFNQTGPLDWNFSGEPSPGVNAGMLSPIPAISRRCAKACGSRARSETPRR